MDRPHLPLNALRAFEASARYCSFTKAAIELCVTQAAVSYQVKKLEEQLNVRLFKRLPRGLMITQEGESLLPVLQDSFDRMAGVLDRFQGGRFREVLSVGAVGTFAAGWLFPRLADFRERHPLVDLRLSTHNNRVDIAAEGLDFAIRFGDGAWHGTAAAKLCEAPFSVLCAPDMAQGLRTPQDVIGKTLLRSYRPEEWTRWFEAAGLPLPVPPHKQVVFDSSLTMMDAVLQGVGLALAPALMFRRHLAGGSICQPFDLSVSMGSYWLTHLKSRTPTPAMLAFRDWLMATTR